MLAPGRYSATCEASPNIALVKYWGQRIPEYNVPYNSSLSLTLDGLSTRTRVTFDPELPADTLELNGTMVEGAPRDDVGRFLDLFRGRARRTWYARVQSRNNFPTASGMASSASGFAALAGAAMAALGLRWGPRNLSRYARRGSGSATRSIYGGFVV
ncbi:mevalonate diphosphate decarboxylase, partial [mine drainage metagenome]